MTWLAASTSVIVLVLQQLVTYEQERRAQTGAEVENEDCEQLVSIVDVERQVRPGDALLYDVYLTASSGRELTGCDRHELT